MTSRDEADAVLDTLDYMGAARESGDSAPAAPDAPGRFAFALDFDSSVVWPDLPFDTASPASHYDPPSRPLIVDTLAAAARIFRDRAPRAWTFVNKEVDSAMIRHSAAIASASSSSNRELVGVCLLTNLHMTPDRVPVTLEALVHEGIHQYLYRLELARGKFCDLADEGRYRSPWSGNRIPLHSLIHASFVWFGLLSLWCQLAQDAASADDVAKVRSRVAPTLFGFTFIRKIMEGPGFPMRSVQPRIAELIGHIAQIGTIAGTGGEGTLRESLAASEKGGWVAQLRQGMESVHASWARMPERA